MRMRSSWSSQSSRSVFVVLILVVVVVLGRHDPASLLSLLGITRRFVNGKCDVIYDLCICLTRYYGYVMYAYV